MFIVFLLLFIIFLSDNLINKKEESKIKIIEIISSEKNLFTNKKNILCFLENKLFKSNKTFKEYKKPVIIIFDYLGTNKIYMKYLSLEPNNKLIKGSGYMEVYTFVNRKKVNITRKFLEIYGHTKNFYSHIKGCYNNFLFMTLKEYNEKYIYIMDEYGKKFKYYIALGNKKIKTIYLK